MIRWKKMRRISILLILAILVFPGTALGEDIGLANSLLYQSERGLQDLADFNSTMLSDMVIEARLLYSLSEFDKSINVSREALRLMAIALNISSYHSYNLILLDLAGMSGIDSAAERIALDSLKEEFSGSGLELVYAKEQKIASGLAARLHPVLGGFAVSLSNLNEKAISQNLSSNQVARGIGILSSHDARLLQSSYGNLVLMNRTLGCIVSDGESINSLGSIIPVPLFRQVHQQEFLLFEKGDFAQGYALCMKNRKSVQDAFKVNDELILLNDKFETARLKSMNMENPVRLAGLARQSLVDNHIEESLNYAGSARLSLEKMVSDDLVFNIVSKSELGFSIRQFLLKYWLVILVIISLLSVFGWIFYGSFRVWNYSRVQSILASKEASLAGQMKSLQKRYFAERKMGAQSYESQMDSLQERLLAVRERMGSRKTPKKSMCLRIRPSVIRLLKAIIARLESKEMEKLKIK
jgi:hypothetical protein